MAGVVPRLAILALVTLGACGEPPRPRAPEAGVDKARVFGDAGLVPTREGEQARRELALAGEIRAALDQLAQVQEVRASVEFGEAPDAPPRVLVTLSTSSSDEAGRSRLEHYAKRAASAVVGPRTRTTVILDVASAPEPPMNTLLPLPLALALLGLGVSAGIAVERYRSRRIS